MAAVRDPATDAAPPPAIQGEARSSLPADPSRATAALYRRHGATVYRYAWHMLGSREDAEDATQATFLSVHTALTSSTPVREPQAWVLKIARNECLGRIAAGMRRPLAASLDDDRVGEVSAPAPSVPRTVELRSDLQAARAALGRLPEVAARGLRAAGVARPHHGRGRHLARHLGVGRRRAAEPGPPRADPRAGRRRRVGGGGLRPHLRGAGGGLHRSRHPRAPGALPVVPRRSPRAATAAGGGALADPVGRPGGAPR